MQCWLKIRLKLAALRAVKSAFLLEKTKEGFSGNISDEQAISKLYQSLYKQRMDAYQMLCRSEKRRFGY